MKLKEKIIAAIGVAALLSGCGGGSNDLWIVDKDGGLGYVNVTTGQLTYIGNMGVVLTDIAFDPQGNLYGISFGDLYSINKQTAQVTMIGSHNNGTGAKNSLVFSSDGRLFAAWDALYTLDVATGTSTLIGNGGDTYRSSGDLAFHKGKLYMSSRDIDSTGDELLEMNIANGSGTSVGTLGAESLYYSLSSNRSKLYTVKGTQIYSVDPTTAALTAVANYAGGALGLANGSGFANEAKL